MKKLLFTIAYTLLLYASSFAQYVTIVTGVVTDSGNVPMQGVAVFVYTNGSIQNPITDPSSYTTYAYTSLSGTYALDFHNTISLSLYPNPSYGVTNLKWDVNLEVQKIKVISLSGKILQELRPIENKIEITKLKASIYLVQIATPDAAKTMRLVVE